VKKRASVTLVVLALVAGIFPSGHALGDERRVADPDDVAGPIDVETFIQGHYFRYIVLRINAYDRWDTEEMAGGEVVFEIDSDRDAEIDQRAVLEFRGGGGSQMRSSVYDDQGALIGRAGHRRPSRRSVEVWIERWMLGRPNSYSAFATVTTAASDLCPDGCTDRAPDEGAVSHDLKPLCLQREATILGSPKNDTIEATRRDDVIVSRGGDDVITGLSGNDVVCGGDGDDVIEGGLGALHLKGGRGDDYIHGSGPRPTPCNDTSGGSAACAFPESLLLGGAGRDTLIGGRYHEHLVGGPQGDVLRGRRQSDFLQGRDGDDLLVGGRGDDGLRGDAGTDTCRSGEYLRTCEHS
jgi:hypothetical protein